VHERRRRPIVNAGTQFAYLIVAATEFILFMGIILWILADLGNEEVKKREAEEKNHGL
jgi:hypothetical protein